MEKMTLQIYKVILEYIMTMSSAQIASSPEEVIEIEKKFKELVNESKGLLEKIGEK